MRHSGWIHLALTLTLTFLTSGFASAATYYVPDNFATIQAALDGVVAGDTIIVRDGTYTGAGNKNLDFAGKTLTLRSENGAARRIIDCQDDGRGFTFSRGESSVSVVDGFSITNGNVGGIFCSSASPTITNCTISGNSASDGGGIYCDFNSSPTITNCTVRGNSASNAGGGIHCFASSAIITNCTVRDNEAGYDRWGAGIYCYGSPSPTITNCIITHNSMAAFGGGGGIACVNQSSPTITGCTISDSTIGVYGLGAGIYCSSSSPTITDCIINGNSFGAQGYGGGIYCEASSSPTITDSAIITNSADAGGALCCVGFSSPTITGCVIRANSCGTEGNGGGIYCGNGAHPTMTNCTINGNTTGSDGHGGGIYCGSDSELTLTSCTISDNLVSCHYKNCWCRRLVLRRGTARRALTNTNKINLT